MNAAGVSVALAHALAEGGEVVVDVDHVGLDGLRRQRTVADVVERHPPAAELLGLADLHPRRCTREMRSLRGLAWCHGTSHVKSTFLSRLSSHCQPRTNARTQRPSRQPDSTLRAAHRNRRPRPAIRARSGRCSRGGAGRCGARSWPRSTTRPTDDHVGVELASKAVGRLVLARMPVKRSRRSRSILPRGRFVAAAPSRTESATSPRGHP